MKTFSMSYTRWERTNFYHWSWRIRGKTALRSFWTNSRITSSRIVSFSQMRKTSAMIRWETHYLLALSSSDIRILMKSKHPVYIMVFGVSLYHSVPIIMLIDKGWYTLSKAYLLINVSSRGVMANSLDCDIVVSEFEFQLHNYVHKL